MKQLLTRRGKKDEGVSRNNLVFHMELIEKGKKVVATNEFKSFDNGESYVDTTLDYLINKALMEREITSLWWDQSVSTSDDHIIGKGNNGSYAYVPSLVEEEELRNYLELLGIDSKEDIELNFYDLMKTKDGDQWTQLHQKLDFFASMLNAAGILEYVEEPKEFGKKRGNPKVKILKYEDKNKDIA